MFCYTKWVLVIPFLLFFYIKIFVIDWLFNKSTGELHFSSKLESLANDAIIFFYEFIWA